MLTNKNIKSETRINDANEWLTKSLISKFTLLCLTGVARG